MKQKQRFRYLLLPILLALLVTAAILLIRMRRDNRVYHYDFSADVQSVADFERTFYVVADRYYAPFSYYDENYRPAGYSVELSYMLARELGYKVNLRLVSSAEALTGLKTGSFEMVVGAVYSEEWAEQYRYSLPVYTDSYVFFGPQDSEPVENTEKLYNRRIAVLRDSPAADGSILPTSLMNNTVLCDSISGAFAAVEAGEADLLLVNRIAGLKAMEDGDYDMEILSRDFAPSPYYVLTNPQDPELGNAVDNALLTLIENGSLDALEQHWLLRYTRADSVWKLLEDEWPLLLALLVFVCLVVLGNVLLSVSSRRKEAITLLETDPMTGLWNRQAFCSRALQEVRKHPERSYAVGRMDFDHFKLYNDAFGSEAGDRLIADFGRRLQEEQQNLGFLQLGHISGDYFAVLLDMDSIDPQREYDRLAAIVQELDPNYPLAFHMGYCPVKDETMDISLACDRAFLAQRSVHNDYERRWAWYDESMRRSVMEERDLNNAMRAALEENQFVPWFQPQYDFSTGSIIGAEVLVRWQHPQKGLLQPGAFVPAFEKNGFIYELDQCVWRAACASIRRWKMAGIKMPPVSVNLSRRDIYHRDLHKVLLSIVREAGLTPADLRLEITESAYMENPEQLNSTICKLSEAGFYLEMDDFGSGYSSLTALKELPFDLVKLDMAFLRGDNGDRKSGSILSSVIHLAHLIDLPVIAEGVETLQQAEYLKSLGCLYMQGYYFSKPIPESEFEALMQNGGIEPLRRTARNQQGMDYLASAGENALLFSSFAGGIAILDYSTRHVSILRANDRFYEEMHLNRMNRKAETDLLEILTGDDGRDFITMLEQAMVTDREADCRVSFRTEEDSRQWIHCRVRFLSKKVNSSLMCLAVENVTRSREQEESLRLREAEYRAAAQMSTEMVCRYNLATRALSVAEETAAVYDSVTYLENAPEEFLRQGYITEDSRERWSGLFRAIHAGEESGFAADLGIATLHSGDFHRYHAAFTAIRGADGQTASAVLSFRETEGKQDERELERIQVQAGQKQRELESRLHSAELLEETVRAGSWLLTFREDGRMGEVRWSSGLRRLLDFRDERDFPNTLEAVENRVHSEDRERTRKEFLTKIRAGEEGFAARFRILTRTGQWLQVLAVCRTERNGAIQRCRGIILDVTKEQQLQEQLEQEKLRYREVLSVLQLGTWYVEDSHSLQADEAMCSVMGISPDTDPETMYNYWVERIAEEDRPAVEGDFARMVNGEIVERVYGWRHPTKGKIYVRCGGYREPGHNSAGRMFGYFQNVDSMVHEEQDGLRAMKRLLTEYRQKEYDRRRDYLTGLYNRQDLHEQLTDRDHPISSVFKLDLDDFSEYNQYYGYVEGDRVLKTVSSALIEYGKVNHILFYRFGGAEILGLNFSSDLPNMMLAKELVELVRNLNLSREDTPTGRITVSVGYTGDVRDPETLIDKADAALRRAREAGKDRASA